MGEAFFIVTKPLQYCNATNIPGDFKRNLIVIDLFSNAKEFTESLLNLKFWDSIIFIENAKSAYEYLAKSITSEDSVFIDSDYGLKKMFWLSKLKTKNIFVYEEGVGSYRNDLLKSSNNPIFVKNILTFLGFKNYFGGSKYVKGIYVYNHDKHQLQVQDFNKQLFSFKNDFLTHLKLINNHFHHQNMRIENIILDLPRNKKINIYLGSWEFNEKIENYIKQNKEAFWVIKPHPHIKNSKINKLFNLNISSSIFVELLLVRLIDEEFNFCVFHENSTALLYFNPQSIRQVNLIAE